MTRPLCSVSRMCDLSNRVVFELGGGYAKNVTIEWRAGLTRQDKVYITRMYVEEPGGAEGASGSGRQGQ